MTELSPGTHVVPPAAADPPAGTVGKLIPSTEMRIVSLDDPGKRRRDRERRARSRSAGHR